MNGNNMNDARVRLEAARKEMDEALQDVRKVVREAKTAGYSISVISRSVGVTRQTVYDMLGEED